MNILIAPDSFKGSVTAKAAAQAMKSGVLKGHPDAVVTMIPMADGGEGTMTSLVDATSGSVYQVEVVDPLGRSILGEYGVTGDGQTAVIELASASGLDTLAAEERDPRIASTYGTGQLVLDALNQGLRHFIICLGGSATNDGGTGLLRALGYRFLDAKGRELEPGGLALQRLHIIDSSQVESQVHEATFQVACDVNNPLVGSNGASAIFGPQKGATSEMVQSLDQALTVFADCIERQTGQSVHQWPGAGAAGGTSAGLLAFLNAELKPGIQVVTEAVGFRDQLKDGQFDMLLTGEGKIDGQTASGKVVAGLAAIAQQYHLLTLAIAGSVEDDLQPLYEKGLTAAFSITDGPMSLDNAMDNGDILIEKQVEQMIRLYSVTF
ncbi:glycerate kinase [Tuberibacillus sp. Marseille-P3662]|uniref:glycerate kinase n=1 Tax=Tuberibacillus sp. Marseille-P3662 TaxID=1965358 RepID=UPI000A1CC486|nr:glycerate kinase [Tuberibacillus sp. Marseille-P3662]